jgi:transcriptional regulator NrdR family protein
VDHSYWREKHPKCPHCKQVQQDYVDAAMWEDGDVWPRTCEDCGKEFWVLTTTTVQFSSAVTEEDASDENCGPLAEVTP